MARKPGAGALNDEEFKAAKRLEARQKVLSQVVSKVAQALRDNPETEELAIEFQKTFANSQPLIETEEATSERIKAALAKRIQGLRESLGMNQSEFARRTGTAQSYIWHIEHKSREPSLSVLARIAAAMGIKLSDLVSVCDT